MLDNTAYGANGPATGYSTLGTASARSTPAYAGADTAVRQTRLFEGIASEAEQLVQMAIDTRVILGDNIDRLIGVRPAEPETSRGEPPPGCEFHDLTQRLSRLRGIMLDIRDHAQRLTEV